MTIKQLLTSTGNVGKGRKSNKSVPRGKELNAKRRSG